jgi:type I restriction enzyme S subunit
MARKVRDSGVEWIGEVPEGWEVIRTKHKFYHTKRVVGDNAKEYERLALTMQGVIKRDKEDSNGLQPKEFEGYQILEENELVFKLIDLQNISTSRVGRSPFVGIVSPAYIVIHPRNESNTRFEYYYFLAMWMHDIFQTLGGDAVRSCLNASDLLNVPLLSPPLPEQRRIADYLDEKCAAIDGAVDELKRGIEDCKAWKKAIIFEAVTGKANVLAAKNANVAKRQMRDSGIPWIGEIPEGWGMECVKHLFSIGRGRVIAATEVEQEGYPVYSSQTKNNGLLGYISSYDYDRNQLTWTTDGANAGTVFLREGKHNCTNVCGTLMPRDDSFSLRFVCYSLGYVTQYERRSDINGFKIMSNEMAHIKFPLPPLPEQQAIANYLDEKCAAIDALVAEKEKLIADLETYKKSLIFELVTGKREVA